MLRRRQQRSCFWRKRTLVFFCLLVLLYMYYGAVRSLLSGVGKSLPVHPLEAFAQRKEGTRREDSVAAPLVLTSERRTEWKHPFPAGRVVVVGDVHGDLRALRICLARTGVINARDQWVGGNSVLVQTGDFVDRTRPGRPSLDDDTRAEELLIYHFMQRLRGEAVLQGGDVFMLLGNHESMNLLGDERVSVYAGPADQRSFGGLQGRLDAFRPGGWFARRLADTHGIFLQLGSWLFVHGSLRMRTMQEMERLLAGTRDINVMNAAVQRFLRGDEPVLGQDELEAVRHLMFVEGPVWVRDFAEDSIDCSLLERVLADYGATRLVIGHTPQAYGANSVCDGHVWRIDTAMSRCFDAAWPAPAQESFNRRPTALVIEAGGGGEARAVVAERTVRFTPDEDVYALEGQERSKFPGVVMIKPV